MGGFTPELIMTVVGEGMSMMQKQNQTRAARQAADAQAGAQAAQIEVARQAADRDREARLARTLASARARFAGRGLDPAQGSAAAVLDGLISESDQEAEDARAQTDIRLGAINARLNRPEPGLLESVFPRLMFDTFRSRRQPRRSLLDF